MNMPTRRTAFLSIVAGFGYIIQAAMGLIKPQTDVFSGLSDYVLEAIFVIALIATIFALLGYHWYAQNRYGRAGSIGLWLTVIGTGLITISALATLFAGQNSLGPAFLGGVLLALIGYVVLGITTLRAKVLPLWCGAALIFGFPLSIFLSAVGGAILFGLAWLTIGYYLMRQ